MKRDLCAFCRVPYPSSDEEEVKRMMNLMEANNAYAICGLAVFHFDGSMGMQQDFAKANELFLRAGELGCASAFYNLGISYRHGYGVELDERKAKHYWELAAMNGNLEARHNIGCMDVRACIKRELADMNGDVTARHNVAGMEGQAGNYDRAFKHFILAAKAGWKNSLDQVKTGFMEGYVNKDEYANTLRAYQDIQDEMKSDTRNKAGEFYGRAAAIRR